MKEVYLNTNSNELFFKKAENVNNGEVTFVNSKDEEMVVPYVYFKEKYKPLNPSIKMLQDKIDSHGENLDIVTLSYDDHKNLLMIINHFLR